jgi:hypothetical protein
VKFEASVSQILMTTLFSKTATKLKATDWRDKCCNNKVSKKVTAGPQVT